MSLCNGFERKDGRLSAVREAFTHEGVDVFLASQTASGVLLTGKDQANASLT